MNNKHIKECLNLPITKRIPIKIKQYLLIRKATTAKVTIQDQQNYSIAKKYSRNNFG